VSCRSWSDRRAAADRGFDAIECWWPFDGPVPADGEADRFVASVRDAGVRLVALNLDGGDLAAGERGILSHPDQRERVAAGLDVAERLVRDLEVEVVHGLVGNRRLGLDPREQETLAALQLARIAARFAPLGVRVVVEALNPWENPLYPLPRTADVLALLDRIERDHGQQVWLLYDLYHAQRTEGELLTTIARHHDRLGHVQVADAPGRGEPGTGEIAVERVLAALGASGYDGWVGLEYLPTTETTASLADLDRWRAALASGGTGTAGQER
jgi:hydroxypyruvate isomerase